MSNRRPSPQALAALGVYALAAAAAMLGYEAYRISGPAWRPTAGFVVVVGTGAALLVCALAALVVGWRRAAPARGARFHVPMVANLVVLAACVGVLEVAARIVTRPHYLGASLGSTVLLPYDWQAVRAFNQSLLERSRRPDSYYVEDRELGWAIGPSRRSSNGIYLSSAEGLRSATQGQTLRSATPTRRIAIFGDSFAFSEEVPFEQSLNVHLEQQLGAGAQVLTFGVPGFGIDQAVLRYEREAAPWKPDVSILQFIADDIHRIGNIYLFNKPDWALPFVKPRFVVRHDALEQLALPQSDEVYRHASVFELPHLDSDTGFDPVRWKSSALSWSRLVQFVVSRRPNEAPPPPVGGPMSNERVAAALIERFVAKAQALGSVPLVVFFPDARALDGFESPSARWVISSLADKGVAVADPTACMRATGGSREWIVQAGAERRPVDATTSASAGVGEVEVAMGVHYSDAGNARMAQCLLPLVQQRLDRNPARTTNN